MPERDRKDLPHSQPSSAAPADETAGERAARKARESRALDEALEETFPTRRSNGAPTPAATSSRVIRLPVRLAPAVIRNADRVNPGQPVRKSSDICAPSIVH
jgi:hypothetical protein